MVESELAGTITDEDAASTMRTYRAVSIPPEAIGKAIHSPASYDDLKNAISGDEWFIEKDVTGAMHFINVSLIVELHEAGDRRSAPSGLVAARRPLPPGLEVVTPPRTTRLGWRREIGRPTSP